MAEGEGDHIHLDATFGEAVDAVRRIAQAEIDQAQELSSLGDAARVEMRQARVKLLEQMQTPVSAAGTRTVGQIEDTTAAIARENGAILQGTRLDSERLHIIQEETQARVAQLEVVERLQNRMGGVAEREARRLPWPYDPAMQAEGTTAGLREQRLAALLAEPDVRLRAAASAGGPSGVYVPRRGGTADYEQTVAARSALDDLNAENAARQRALFLEQQQLESLRAMDAEQARIAQWQERASRIGMTAGLRGKPIPESLSSRMMAGPSGVNWTKEQADLAKYNMVVNEYAGFERNAAVQTGTLTTNITRLGVQQAESSDALRRHGALTTEYLQALARGETTIREFGYQLGATTAKFGGWALAAGAVYALFGALKSVTTGATDAASGAQRLSRTIETGFSTSAATKAITDLSSQTNVSVKESADAIFQYSRVFHTIPDATAAASMGIQALKLDNVSLSDSVALSTGIFQQWNATAAQQQGIWNMLAAGQREYNARISQTTVILRGTQAAVRNAGGDLTQLTQLAILGARALPGNPGQVATALSRSASTYARENLLSIQNQFGIGRGMTPSTYNFTELFEQAVRLSPSLGQQRRSQLANLFFDPRLAARVGAAYFGPQGGPELAQIQRTITPTTTQGAMWREFQKEVATAHERLRTVTNEFGRIGAVIGASGIVNGLTGIAVAAARAGGALRGAVQGFDFLPGPIKEAAIALVALRSAMLFTQRTRFGSTLADVTGLSRVPGFGANRAQSARFELRAGTTQALEAETQRWMQSRAKLLSLGAEQLEVEKQAARINAQIVEAEASGNASDKEIAALKEESNAINQRISRLSRIQAATAYTESTQQKTRDQLIAQRRGLERSPRRGGYSDAEVLALSGAVDEGTVGAEDAASRVTLSQVASQRLAAARVRLAGALKRDAAVTTRLAAGESVVVESAAAGQRAVTVAEAEAAASTGVFAGLQASFLGLSERLTGMVAAIDPMMAALIILPFVAGEISDVAAKGKQAAEAASQAASEPVTSLNSLQQTVQHLQSAAARQAAPNISGGPLGILQNSLKGLGSIIGGRFGGELQDWATQRDPAAAERTSNRADQLQGLGRLWNAQERVLRTDIQELAKSDEGRQRLNRAAQEMRQRFANVLRAQGFSAADVNQVYGAYATEFGNVKDSVLQSMMPRATGIPAQFNLLSQLSDTGLRNWGTAYANRSRAYGLNRGDISGAIGAAMTMAARYRNSNDPTQLSALEAAQQTVADAVGRNVTTLINASKTAGSARGAQADLSKARGNINTARQQIQQWVAELRRQYGNIPGVMKFVNEFAQQLNQQLDTSVANVLQEQLADIKSQADLRTSRIGGIDTAADIRRASSDLQGVKEQLQAARKVGDWKQANDLQVQVNNQQRSVQQQQAQYALDLRDSYGKLASSQITGISPEADLRRAARDVQSARDHLAIVQERGMGEKATVDAQADLNDKLNALHKQQIDYADSLAQAYEALAVSRITGITPAADLARARQDVENAREDLARHQREGKGLPQLIQDQANLDDKIRALNEMARSNAQQTSQNAAAFIQSQEALAASQTTDPVRQATLQLDADRRILATIKPTDYKTYQEYLTARNNQLAKVNQDQVGRTSSIIDTRMQTLQYELHTQQISGQQYIYGLEQLLKLSHLSKQQIQTIRGAIYDEAHAQAVNLNTANIRLPTTYEVRRAIASAMRQGGRIPQNTGTVINHHVSNRVTITVNAGNAAEMRRVAAMLDRTTKGNLAGRARAAGLI